MHILKSEKKKTVWKETSHILSNSNYDIIEKARLSTQQKKSVVTKYSGIWGR